MNWKELLNPRLPFKKRLLTDPQFSIYILHKASKVYMNKWIINNYGSWISISQNHFVCHFIFQFTQALNDLDEERRIYLYIESVYYEAYDNTDNTQCIRIVDIWMRDCVLLRFTFA